MNAKKATQTDSHANVHQLGGASLDGRQARALRPINTKAGLAANQVRMRFEIGLK